MNITIQCFGAFRPLGEQIHLSISPGSLVSDIRTALLRTIQQMDVTFDTPGLIDSSRFATETTILAENTALHDGMTLAIIPPVSGG